MVLFELGNPVSRYTRSVQVMFLTGKSCLRELSADLRLFVSHVSLEYNIAAFKALHQTLNFIWSIRVPREK